MKTLYHGTSSANLASIKAIGLVPGHAKGGDVWAKEHHMLLAVEAKHREPSVFVADHASDAKNFAHYAAKEMGGDPIIITLHVPQDVFDTYVVDELFEQDDDDTPHAWRAHSVPAEYVGEIRKVATSDDEDITLMD